MKPKKHSPKQPILLVEDSITQAEKLKFILEEAGHTVDWVSDSDQALEYLETNVPQVIISDVMMPGMDGYQFCNQIKQNPDLCRIPVMLLTSLSGLQDIIQGLECGADHFITKPFRANYLITQVEYLLANVKLRKMARENAAQMPEIGIDMFFAGKKHHITSTQFQILDLLFSTFEILVQKNKELEVMNRQLMEKQSRIKALQDMVPICSNCKKIRDDDGYWQHVEEYLEKHSEADFNLSTCPQCATGDSSQS